jgi:NADPH:quinone reductase-like Zn-dependent oxidoreductase
MEVLGVVDAAAPGAEQWVGRRVVAIPTGAFGGYAEQVVAPEVMTFEMPASVPYPDAAAIYMPFHLAWLGLRERAGLRGGETVLVHAAAGGVGQAALQICTWRGARVIGTASASKHERLRAAGVAHCIDYTTQDFEAEVARITDGKGVDIVLDAVGGKSFAKSYRSLAPLGRLFVFGASGFAPSGKRNFVAVLRGFLALPTFKPMRLMNQNRGVFGVNMGHLWEHADKLGAMMQEIVGLVGKGVLDPVVDKTFPFDRASEAHAYLQARGNFGKVLLNP